MQEKENILDILIKTRKAVRENDAVALKELSNRTLHSSSIYQDPDNIAIAVIVYSLGKIMEREKYREYKSWPKFFKDYMKCINKSIDFLKADKLEEFRKEIQHITTHINELSGHLKQYIKDVFERAKINKASRIYEHGISMETTAKLLGISMWELVEYAGRTGIGDVNLGITLDVKKRVKNAMDIFEK